MLFLFLSIPALIVSFFDIGHLPIDASWLAILLCGIPIIKGAVEGLVTKFNIKADVLVSIALIASIVIGETFAAGEVAFIMAISAYLEEHTVAKAHAGIEKLVHLTPATARVVRGGREEVIPSQQVEIGNILRVLAGETVAVDGMILKGQTSTDQSVMTGESLPVDKAEGDEVFSGAVNQFGTFDMIAQKVGEDSSLQRMIRLVESADAGKAKIVGIADRWAAWIVVTALHWPLESPGLQPMKSSARLRLPCLSRSSSIAKPFVMYPFNTPVPKCETVWPCGSSHDNRQRSTMAFCVSQIVSSLMTALTDTSSCAE